MNELDDILRQLIDLSHHLGEPDNEYAILGEGNTSARIDSEYFWVKASGSELRTIDPTGFVKVRFDRCANTLKEKYLSDEEVKTAVEQARADPTAKRRPSVETFLHALALNLDGVNYVGHTHPTAVNAVLCSQNAEKAVLGRLFPDEIVVCGPAPVFIPYTDPGLPLAQAVDYSIQKYLDDFGQVPKVILMQNHGFIALGKSAAEVKNITAMYVKTCRILLGTFSLGGPHFLSSDNVNRIHNRPDEIYRRKVIGAS